MNDAWYPSIRIPQILNFLLAIGMLGCWLATTAQAEWYVGGYGGISVPGALSNITASDTTLGGGVTNARINDLELESGLLGGVKGAISLSRVLGWE